MFQNFPPADAQLGSESRSLCGLRGTCFQPSFLEFIQGTYDAQADITESNADDKLNTIADAAGVKSADIAVCAAKSETVGRVERSVELGRSLNVTSTPSLFI